MCTLCDIELHSMRMKGTIRHYLRPDNLTLLLLEAMLDDCEKAAGDGTWLGSPLEENDYSRIPQYPTITVPILNTRNSIFLPFLVGRTLPAAWPLSLSLPPANQDR